MNQVLTKSIGSFLCLLLCGISYAGHVTGNGGSAVVCRDEHYEINKVELFDYYEAKYQYNIQIDMDESITDPVLLAETTMKRLESYDPERAGKYIEQIRHFFDNANLVPGITLEYVPDTEGIITPTNCHIQQLAIQRQPEFSHDRYFTISKDLWDLLPVRDRAGLILHEIIYREAISYGQRSSISARYFNSLISSHELEKLSPDGYQDLLFKIGFIASLHFEQKEPSYATTPFTDPRLSANDQFKTICPNQAVGTIVSAKDRFSLNWAVCLGHFGPINKPFFSNYRMKDLQITSVYMAVFTDEVDGVMDTSVIGLFETENSIIPFCDSTTFSDKTIRARYAKEPIDKSNPSQIQSLQKGQGVCSNFFLDDYRDFTKGTLILDERIQRVQLKKVF